jgi:hypothetical protein
MPRRSRQGDANTSTCGEAAELGTTLRQKLIWSIGHAACPLTCPCSGNGNSLAQRGLLLLNSKPSAPFDLAWHSRSTIVSMYRRNVPQTCKHEMHSGCHGSTDSQPACQVIQQKHNAWCVVTCPNAALGGVAMGVHCCVRSYTTNTPTCRCVGHILSEASRVDVVRVVAAQQGHNVGALIGVQGAHRPEYKLQHKGRRQELLGPRQLHQLQHSRDTK